MRQKSISQKDPAEKVVRDIRRKTRRKHFTEEKIRIVLEGLRGEESVFAFAENTEHWALHIFSPYIMPRFAILESFAEVDHLVP
jgi:hypothetical protein